MRFILKNEIIITQSQKTGVKASKAYGSLTSTNKFLQFFFPHTKIFFWWNFSVKKTKFFLLYNTQNFKQSTHKNLIHFIDFELKNTAGPQRYEALCTGHRLKYIINYKCHSFNWSFLQSGSFVQFYTNDGAKLSQENKGKILLFFPCDWNVYFLLILR